MEVEFLRVNLGKNFELWNREGGTSRFISSKRIKQCDSFECWKVIARVTLNSHV